MDTLSGTHEGTIGVLDIFGFEIFEQNRFVLHNCVLFSAVFPFFSLSSCFCRECVFHEHCFAQFGAAVYQLRQREATTALQPVCICVLSVLMLFVRFVFKEEQQEYKAGSLWSCSIIVMLGFGLG